MQMHIKGCEQFENTWKVEERGETFVVVAQKWGLSIFIHETADRGVFVLKYVCRKKANQCDCVRINTKPDRMRHRWGARGGAPLCRSVTRQCRGSCRTGSSGEGKVAAHGPKLTAVNHATCRLWTAAPFIVRLAAVKYSWRNLLLQDHTYRVKTLYTNIALKNWQLEKAGTWGMLESGTLSLSAPWEPLGQLSST